MSARIVETQQELQVHLEGYGKRDVTFFMLPEQADDIYEAMLKRRLENSKRLVGPTLLSENPDWPALYEREAGRVDTLLAMVERGGAA